MFPSDPRTRQGLGTATVLCLKKEDDFVGILSVAKQVLFRKTSLNAFWQVSVVAARPLRKVADLVSDEQETGHESHWGKWGRLGHLAENSGHLVLGKGHAAAEFVALAPVANNV